MKNIAAQRRYLANQNFSELKLDGKDMRATRAFGSSWYKCSFEGVVFDSSTFQNATFTECNFSACSFQNTSFVSARIVNSEFYRCDLVQCDVASAVLTGSTFILCKFEYSSFLDAFMESVRFYECNMTGAHLLYAASKDVDYTGSNLHNCSVRLGCPFFRGSTFDGRQWSFMQSLISETRGNEDRHANVVPMIEKRVLEATRRMMNDPEEEEKF